jgi:hypothetical protein
MLFVFNPRRHLGNSQTTTTMSSNSKAVYFPDDVFKQIISYTQSLPKCEKCPCVATDKCLNCILVFCKKHLSTDDENNAVEGLCDLCVDCGYVTCDLCPGEYTNMECENCAQMYCGECCATDGEDGLCCECSPEEDDE